MVKRPARYQELCRWTPNGSYWWRWKLAARWSRKRVCTEEYVSGRAIENIWSLESQTINCCEWQLWPSIDLQRESESPCLRSGTRWAEAGQATKLGDTWHATVFSWDDVAPGINSRSFREVDSNEKNVNNHARKAGPMHSRKVLAVEAWEAVLVKVKGRGTEGSKCKSIRGPPTGWDGSCSYGTQYICVHWQANWLDGWCPWS